MLQLCAVPVAKLPEHEATEGLMQTASSLCLGFEHKVLVFNFVMQ
jgi:hypothetical protein